MTGLETKIRLEIEVRVKGEEMGLELKVKRWG
jgi:hypothetical protein